MYVLAPGCLGKHDKMIYGFLASIKMCPKRCNEVITRPEAGDKLQMGYKSIMRTDQWVSEWVDRG